MLRLEQVSRQRDDYSKADKDLCTIQAEFESSAAGIKKVVEVLMCNFIPLSTGEVINVCFTTFNFMLQLRKELQRAKQTHSGEVEGMRKEVSKLTDELHQRDLTIATLSGSSFNVKQRLCDKLEGAEQKAAELQVCEQAVI